MYDGDHRLVVWNNRFVELYGFPPGFVTLGRPFGELFEYLVATGNIKEQTDRYAALRAERLENEKVYFTQHMLADGRTIAIINHAMERRRLGFDARRYHRSEEHRNSDRATGPFRRIDGAREP